MQRLLSCSLLLSFLCPSAMAGVVPDTNDSHITTVARVVFADRAASVVNVGGILSVDLGMMGQQEQELDLIGTVVHESGLTVVSNSALNPFGDEPLDFEPQPGMAMPISAELSQVWFQLSDGKRIDAVVVLKDTDLDLAFIRPIEGDSESFASLKPVDLGMTTAQVSMFDSVIAIGRLSKTAGWAPSAHLRRISAVIEQPRTCYVAETLPGMPVFDGQGKLIGITVALVDTENGIDPMQLMMGGSAGGGIQSVVLPAGEIKSLIEQAKQL